MPYTKRVAWLVDAPDGNGLSTEAGKGLSHPADLAPVAGAERQVALKRGANLSVRGPGAQDVG